MATPRRRSARLRASATPETHRHTPLSTNKLSSLIERDETPETGTRSNLNTILTSPIASPPASRPDRLAELSSPSLRTPKTAPRPSSEEMHPGNFQKSTTKKPSEVELELGFADISEGQRRSINAAQGTPTKAASNYVATMTSPSFEFKFASDSHLSDEARKLMSNVREDAARIKAEMLAQRKEQERKDGETDKLYSTAGRKIATPKGRAGRFSDVHMAEFKKMDSIANHPSSFRTQASNHQQPGNSLKRSNSKAGLDEPDRPRTAGPDAAPSVKSTSSLPRTVSVSPSKSMNTLNMSQAQSAINSPSKRIRQLASDDISTARPVSRDSNAETHPSTLPRPKSGFFSSITTPTKASLARSATVKTPTPSTPNFPSLPRSASVKQLRTVEPAGLSLTRSPSTRTISTTSKVEMHSRLPTFAGLKSILRRRQPLFSDDPAKIAAGTHVASPSGALDLNKALPAAPGSSSSDDLSGQKSPRKQVKFTPSTHSRHAPAETSPSPTDVPASVIASLMDPADIAYPELPSSTTPIALTQNSDSKPRSSIGKPREIKETKSILAKFSSPTIRRVRESGITAPIQPFEDLPAIAHGMSNKKRHRLGSPDQDTENKVPGGYPAADEDGPSSKRRKAEPAEPLEKKVQTLTANRPVQRSGGDAARARKGEGVLSLSRLNMLSRPKERH